MYQAVQATGKNKPLAILSGQESFRRRLPTPVRTASRTYGSAMSAEAMASICRSMRGS